MWFKCDKKMYLYFTLFLFNWIGIGNYVKYLNDKIHSEWKNLKVIVIFHVRIFLIYELLVS